MSKFSFRAIFVIMKRFLIVFMFTIQYASTGQGKTEAVRPKNLVPNGSFENYRRKSGDIRKAIPWRQIETIDYYQSPLSNDTTAHRGAAAGECYAGFRFRKKYREF